MPCRFCNMVNKTLLRLKEIAHERTQTLFGHNRAEATGAKGTALNDDGEHSKEPSPDAESDLLRDTKVRSSSSGRRAVKKAAKKAAKKTIKEK